MIAIQKKHSARAESIVTCFTVSTPGVAAGRQHKTLDVSVIKRAIGLLPAKP